MKDFMQKKLDNKGFTIVEVLIVLAIAGAVLAGILIAVPALQRNSRNIRAKQAANTLVAAISDNEAANNGSAPVATSATNVLTMTGTGSPVVTTTASVAGVKVVTQATAPSATVGTVYVVTSATCSNGATTIGASSTQFSVSYAIEASGGTTMGCVQG